MNSELASNEIRQAIDEAIRRYHTPHPVGATHIDRFNNYYKLDFGTWYKKRPFDKFWEGIWWVMTDDQYKALGIEKL